MRTFRLAVVAASLAALASRAAAVEVADGKLTVSGFGHWGYGQTGNANGYLLGDEEGQYDNAQFSLAFTAFPQEDLVVAGQVFLAAEGEVSLDWAFAEYRLSDPLRLRAGKVKNPLGIFMEVKDVGTLRPFFSLPQSIYGPANFAAEAYYGAGATGAWEGERWGLAYDLYVGALSIPAFEPTSAPPIGAGGTAPPYDFTQVDVEEEEATGVVGGRLVLSTPIDGLTFRLSGFEGSLEEADREGKVHMTSYGLSAEYAIERLQLRGEAFRAREGELETNAAAYAEAAFSVLPRLQVALRFEWARQTKEGVPDDSPFLRHDEVAVGLAYWPSPNLVVKTSYHHVEGNRFAVPALSADDGTVPLRTDLFVAGAQFSF